MSLDEIEKRLADSVQHINLVAVRKELEHIDAKRTQLGASAYLLCEAQILARHLTFARTDLEKTVKALKVAIEKISFGLDYCEYKSQVGEVLKEALTEITAILEGGGE